MFCRKKKPGAVLSIETVLYIAVILIFMTVGLLGVRHFQDESRIATARASLSEIAGAASHYHYDTGVYPSSLDNLTTKYKNYYGPWLTEDKKKEWAGRCTITNHTTYCTVTLKAKDHKDSILTMTVK